MKKILLAVLILSTGLFAQRQTVIEGEIESGGFGGPVVKLTPLKGNAAVLVGGYGGWLINHHFLLGGGGYGLVNNIKANDDVQRVLALWEQPYLNFAYGGAVLEYYFNPDAILHSSVSLLIGGGEVSYRGSSLGDNHDFFYGMNGDRLHDAVFVLEPGLSAEINMTTYFKLGLGISYRYVSGIDTYGLKNADFNNLSGGLAFKFGVF